MLWILLSFLLGVIIGAGLMCILQIGRVNQRRRQDSTRQK